MRAFPRFAWSVLGYNVAVVAWGAYVRATGSGAGCGRHWPTCDGVVVPRGPSAEMAIEYAHRATSGLALVLVVALAVWAFRAFPRGHLARRGAALSLAFIVAEALLGAALVLFGWVAKDASLARTAVVPLHLTNTFLLLGSLTLTAWWSARPGPFTRAGAAPALTGLLAAACATVVLAAASGGIAALGDTLFPSASVGAGFSADGAPGSHLLVRLRVLHPGIASLAAIACAFAARAAASARPEPAVRRAAGALLALVAGQVGLGVLNVVLLAPVWLQLVHLVVADLVWIALVLTTASALEAPARESGVRRRELAV